MVVGVQILGLLFGLFMLYVSFIRMKRNEFTVKEGVFWIIIWVAFGAVSLFPQALDFLSWRVLKISRTIDLLIIVGMIFLAGSTFYIYTLVRMNQRQLEQMVRSTAIEKAEKKRKD